MTFVIESFCDEISTIVALVLEIQAKNIHIHFILLRTRLDCNKYQNFQKINMNIS